jgi:asparagine synthase (glutamine-hydrolysing)
MLDIKIQLNHNYGYKWYSLNGIYVKGYIFSEDNHLYDNANLIEYFKDVSNENEFKIKLKKANGLFTVIIQKDRFLMVAVDGTRTFPLFYTKENNQLLISDDTYFLKKYINASIDDLSVDEFLAARFVTGKYTLLKNIYQVQAAEYLTYENNQLKSIVYSNYTTSSVTNKNFNRLKEDFFVASDNAIERLIKMANGKQLVIPLSGGYDSRLIVSLLKKYKYENVLCFTYGKKDSFEVDISEKVATKLHFKWLFIEYNEKTINKKYVNSKEFQEYYRFFANHTSVLLTQEYFAVKYLFDNDLIDKNAIFVPGHTSADNTIGDSKFDTTQTIVIKDILLKHYNLKHIYNIDEMKIRIKKLLSSNGYSYSKHEDWELKEKESKFIINANKTYEFFGYKHYMPLFDHELILFFKHLPLELKVRRYFYEKVLLEDYFTEFNIDFRKSKDKKYKILLRKIFPSKLKQIIKKQLSGEPVDFNNFNLLNIPIQNEVESKYEFYEIDSLLANWYILKIRNEV